MEPVNTETSMAEVSQNRGVKTLVWDGKYNLSIIDCIWLHNNLLHMNDKNSTSSFSCTLIELIQPSSMPEQCQLLIQKLLKYLLWRQICGARKAEWIRRKILTFWSSPPEWNDWIISTACSQHPHSTAIIFFHCL